MLAPAARIDHDRCVSWAIEIGVGAVIVVVALLAWMSRERDASPNYGTISDQWRNEQRLRDRESGQR